MPNIFHLYISQFIMWFSITYTLYTLNVPNGKVFMNLTPLNRVCLCLCNTSGAHVYGVCMCWVHASVGCMHVWVRACGAYMVCGWCLCFLCFVWMVLVQEIVIHISNIWYYMFKKNCMITGSQVEPHWNWKESWSLMLGQFCHVIKPSEFPGFFDVTDVTLSQV